jgi:hypothetical protein
MERQFYLNLVITLGFLGVVFISVGTFFGRAEIFKSESPERRQFYARRAEKFRYGGRCILGVASFLLLVLLFFPRFARFPSENFLLRTRSLLQAKVEAPWGRINLPAMFVFLGIGLFLFFAGLEHWKLRHNYCRAFLCFALGAIVAIEGILQWG